MPAARAARARLLSEYWLSPASQRMVFSETTKNEFVGRQADFSARQLASGGALAVIGLVDGADRKGRDLVGQAVLGRNGDVVAEQIVEFRHRNRADEAEIGGLDGGRPPAQQGDAAAIGDAVEVDQDVDFIGAHLPRGVLVGKVFDDAVMVEGGDDAPAKGGPVLVAGAVAENLEAGTVVAFEQLGDQVAHRVAAKIR